MVGKAGDDIKIWCGLENDTPEASSDNKAAYFLGFIKKNKKYQK